MDLGKVYPNYQVLKTGGELVITCGSVSTAKWYKNGNFLPVVSFLINVLRINQVTDSDSGEYTCQGHRDAIMNLPFEAVAKVLVVGKCIF